MSIVRRRQLLLALGLTALAGCMSCLRDHPLFSHFHRNETVIMGETYDGGTIIDGGPIISGQASFSPLQPPPESAPPRAPPARSLGTAHGAHRS